MAQKEIEETIIEKLRKVVKKQKVVADEQDGMITYSLGEEYNTEVVNVEKKVKKTIFVEDPIEEITLEEKNEEPVVEETPTEYPVIEETSIEDPATEGTQVEETSIEEPIEEPAAEEIIEEPSTEETPVEETTPVEEVPIIEEQEEKEKEEPESKKDKAKAPLKQKEEPFEPHIGERHVTATSIDDFNETFKSELMISNTFIKECYSEIRNMLDDYHFTRTMSEHYEEFYFDDELVIRISLFDRALRMYLNLDEEENTARYSLIDYKGNYGYNRVNYMHKVNSPYTLKLAIELIKKIIRKYKIQETVDYKYFDFVGLLTTKSIIKLTDAGFDGFIDRANKEQADLMDNEMMEKGTVIERGLKEPDLRYVASISVGELSAAFKQIYTIDLKLLKEVGLVPKRTTYLKVTSGGKCTRKITIKADEFEDTALKMILLARGNAVRII